LRSTSQRVIVRHLFALVQAMPGLNVAVTSFALLAIAPNVHAQAQPLPDSVRFAINRAFSTSANDAPGCALAVSRNGAIIFENGYGMANLETGTPITAASIFHVASVSKQFTAMAIMLLQRDGKLSVDDDIHKYLPEIPDYGQKITIRHLLNHRSGLRDQWELLIMARGGRFEENRITENDVLEIVSRQKSLNFTPGSEYLYSNTGYTLAAVIVKRVSGKSLREFADERIFKPLGMRSTHFHDDYTMVVPGRTSAYARTANGQWRVSIPNYDTYGATSLFSTVGDLLKWEANFTTKTVGDESIFRAMNASAVLTNGDSTFYGFGRVTETYRRATLVGHSGGDAGYATYVGQFPEHAIGIAVFCNGGNNPSLLTRRVADVIIGSKLAPMPATLTARATLTPDQLRPLAGVYANPVTGGVLFVVLRGNNLVLGRAAGPTLVPLTARRFGIDGSLAEYEFQQDGSLLIYGRPSPPQAPQRFTRYALAELTPAQLKAYAGTYRSDELGATYTVTATDSTLVLNSRWGTERAYRVAYAEVFTGPNTLVFTRKSGRIDGMLMTGGRVRRVRFERVN
jgi:CubicO group peptidase (beta-lactamase class C family)